MRFLEQNITSQYWWGLQSHSMYRYSFNGMEKDDEIKGNGNSYDYGERFYDSRLGKFLSTDPMKHNYAMLTPYQFAGNSPIQAIDLDGTEGVKVVDHVAQTTTITLYIIYVPSTEPGETSGITTDKACEWEQDANSYLNNKGFEDCEYEKDDGSGYEVIFNIQYVEVCSMEEAVELKRHNYASSTILQEKVPEGGMVWDKTTNQLVYKETQGSTNRGIILLSPTASSWTSIHEICHALAHFSNNAPLSEIRLLMRADPTQHELHEGKYGKGIFSYKNESGTPGRGGEINQENVNLILEGVKPVENADLVIPEN